MLTADSGTDVLNAPSRMVADTRLDFRRAALEHLERAIQRSATRVAVDLSHTVEIDASGLGVLVLLQKRARERMIAIRLINAPSSVKQMLELTKLDYLFELEG
jgi:anti-anti-sigma factor